MFNIPASKVKEFETLTNNHQLNVSACNIFFDHIRLVAKRPRLLTREDYYDYFNIFSDIELQTAPIDTFVETKMNVDETSPETESDNIEETMEELNEKFKLPEHIVEINRLCPEFIKIQDRISVEEIKKNFPEDHFIVETFNDPEAIIEQLLDQFTEDCFFHWSVNEYMKSIDKLRLAMISNFTPVIEWTVANIGVNEIKSYKNTNRINEENFVKFAENNLFDPDYKYLCKFYKDRDISGVTIDVDDLLKKLVSNKVLKSDIYIVIAIYLILKFARVPIEDGNMDDTGVKYIREVLSQF